MKKELNLYEQKLLKLVDAGKKAFDLLILEIERPIDAELQDDRARNAMKSKKECFMDAKEIISAVQKLEALLNGEEVGINDLLKTKEETSAYEGGYAEKFAKNKK